jgi:two-component system phosphate regulon response regulator PhoB
MYCRWLERNGLSTFAAASGPEALVKAKSLLPDLILLDINLGSLSGIAVYRALQRQPTTSSIPVILATGLAGPDDLLDCAQKELGCGRIWRKPGDLTDLSELISQVLSHANASPARRNIAGGRAPGRIIRRGTLKVDVLARRAWCGDQELPRLPTRRFELLCALIRRDGPVDQDDLLKELWGLDHDLKSVQMTVARLREDLKDFPALQIRTDLHAYELVVATGRELAAC